jgi:AAA+ ATPase superfamily predicted ATPase
MPGYLARFDPARSLEENVRHEMLDPTAALCQEARFLLMEVLREPRNYFSILRAVAWGKTQLNDIAQEAGLPTRLVSKYLDVLRDLHLVERQVPVTERHPERSRRGLYRIVDNYVASWFRFVLPHQAYLEDGRGDWVLAERIRPALSTYMGPRFEEICRQFLRRCQGGPMLDVSFERVGGWWLGREESDIVAVREGQVVLVGECKWTREWMKPGDLADLQRKAALLGVGEGTTYALFSRSGFDPNLMKLAAKQKVGLYGVEQLFADTSKKFNPLGT